ncbi:MAG: hypothetical protein HYW25_05850 [Candidatus Aenigmarchaeota archaeon]|nr:hypothetical protein [Candidatus Aenigmarchaeota archaeon]
MHLVYQVRRISKMRRMIEQMPNPPEEKLAMLSLMERETRFRREDLREYGLQDAEIDHMVETGFLKEAEVNWREK